MEKRVGGLNDHKESKGSFFLFVVILKSGDKIDFIAKQEQQTIHIFKSGDKL